MRSGNRAFLWGSPLPCPLVPAGQSGCFRMHRHLEGPGIQARCVGLGSGAPQNGKEVTLQPSHSVELRLAPLYATLGRSHTHPSSLRLWLPP